MSEQIRHIGYLALCSGQHATSNFNRIDLGSARYKQLGVKELFSGEKPYRVCKRCLHIIIRRERK